MEFNELLEKRKSIRKYKENVSISENEINEMIKTLQYAPSWKNSQTGRYYVALTKDAKEKVYDALPSFNQNNSKNCAAYIVTAFRKDCSGFNMDGTPTNELGNLWGGYDLGLANQLLLLKASELGYDTLIMGIRNQEALRKIFEIPENEIIVSVIALGKRDIDLPRPVRKEINEIAKIK